MAVKNCYLVSFDLSWMSTKSLYDFSGAHCSPFFIAVLVDSYQFLQVGSGMFVLSYAYTIEHPIEDAPRY